MKLKFCLILFSISLLISTQASSVKPSQEWLDNKFSMFIHFGLYSVYGGVYEGEAVRRGYSEQIQSFAGIFSDWYGNTAKQFNPTEWDSDSIVALAKAAGMNSIVFTSKHHDGFCMYHSDYTDFNIVDATPYGKDLMKDLADACRRGGIGFGVYYSLIDWHYPHAYPISSHNADPLTEEHYEFNLKQVEEIMTNYGDISEIWFDMGSLTTTQSKGLYELVNRLQPECMISGRLGNDYVDFAVMADNEYPDYKMGVPWQTAASMFDETWGYRSWQERGEVQPKVEEKIASLVNVISRGGNYLLNIGPRDDGSIVEFEKEVLLGIGDWIDKNNEAIYGTFASPFHSSFEWVDITTKNNTLYAFVNSDIKSSNVELTGFKGKVQDLQLLSTGNSHSFEQKKNQLEFDVKVNEYLPVYKTSFAEEFSIDPKLVVSKRTLNFNNGLPLFGHSSLNYYAGYKSLIGYDWVVKLPKLPKRNITPSIFFTESEIGRRVKLQIDNLNNDIVLNTDQTTALKAATTKRSVKWGDLYRKPGRGVFGNLEEEGKDYINTKHEEGWINVTDFNYSEPYTEDILPRESVVFLQEIDSDRDQTAAVKVAGGNGVYILLNGEYITAHLSPERLKSQEEIILLPLKKGTNQLVVKFYNGFEYEFTYSITPIYEWLVYEKKLDQQKLKGKEFHKVSLRSADSESHVSPLRLNNVVVNF